MITHLKHTKGDLLALARVGHFNCIVQGCNCFCTMGSGIAKQIKQEYPEAYAVDCETVKGDRNKLGTYSVMLGKQFNIINAYTQYDYNRKGLPVQDHFDYKAFGSILRRLESEFEGCHFGFPYIGMGLAGGNKEKILAMLEIFACNMRYTGGSVTLVEYEKEK